MALARNRQMVVTADGATNQTSWITLKHGGVITLEGSFSATVTLQRKGSDGNIVDVTNNSAIVSVFTQPGTYTLTPDEVPAQYRLNCKQGSFISGTLNAMIEGR